MRIRSSLARALIANEIITCPDMTSKIDGMLFDIGGFLGPDHRARVWGIPAAVYDNG